MIDTIVQAITSFVSSVFLKGSDEVGKSLGKDVYYKVKEIFKKNNQKNILDKLEQQPASRENQESFSSALLDDISKSNALPKEVTYILTMMSVDAAILETKFKSYRKLKYEHDLHYISWTESSGEADEDAEKKIKMVERKLHILNKEVMEMFGGNHEVLNR